MHHVLAPQPAPIPDRRRWWSFHEAGYTVAARALGVKITPSSRERPLRCFEGHLRWPVAAESDAALLAIVALSGHAPLDRCGGDGDRDELLARDLIFHYELALRFGPSRTPAYCRQHMTSRMKELTAKADRLVDARWPAIEAEAARLVATQRH